MKRHLSLVTLLLAGLLAAAPASAQLTGKSFGVSGGYSLSNLGGIGSDWMGSGTAGLYGAVRTWSHTVIMLEGNWAKRGIEGASTTQLEFPLLFGAGTDQGDVIVRGYTGIRFGFELSCEDGDVHAGRYQCANTNSTQWAWPLGLQLGKQLQNGMVVGLDVRYAYGLSNAYSSSTVWNQSWEFKVVIGKGF